MSDLFSGLDDLGLGKVGKDIDIYGENEAEHEQKKEPVHVKEKPKITEADVLFDKTYTCPVCDKTFKSKMIKTGKVQLNSMDTDLRPKYRIVDSLKYDAIICPHCGFGALSRFFNYLSSGQAKLIREQVSSNFKGLKAYGEIYTYDDAITRHKIALVNTIVKRAKMSERAYVCLKLAWLYRGKAESLPENTPNLDKVRQDLKKQEDELIIKAYEGFNTAFSKETFPICGMDEMTLTYLTADLARRCKQYDEATRWISKVLTGRDVSERIKAKAREIKEMIREEREKEEK